MLIIRADYRHTRKWIDTAIRHDYLMLNKRKEHTRSRLIEKDITWATKLGKLRGKALEERLEIIS